MSMINKNIKDMFNNIHANPISFNKIQQKDKTSKN
jgi:hypothetical protein